jgi:glycine/D-amino acid oxidase-like deaminating enzyme
MATHSPDRRTLLQLLAGLFIAPIQNPQSKTRHVVIAGGGIIGANLAYRFARRGAAVTLLERSKPGAGATANSFAWINATYSKQPWTYFNLNRLGIEAWQALDRELPGQLPLRWGGSVEWYADDKRAAAFREEIRKHQEWGYLAHSIDEAALRTLEPRVEPGRVALAAHAELEGSVDPVGVTELLLARAASLGARIVHPAEVTSLDQPNGRLRAVKSTAGDIEADALIVACGTDTPRVAAMAGVRVPLKDSPGVLVHTPPQPQRLLERVVLSPIAHMKQKPDGRIVTGSGFGGTPTTDSSREAGERFLETASRVLPAFRGMGVEKVTLGHRPLPADEFPVIGFPAGRRDVYIAVMHSGVTLSPLVAQLAAIEMLDGVDAQPLAPYRPARFKA